MVADIVADMKVEKVVDKKKERNKKKKWPTWSWTWWPRWRKTRWPLNSENCFVALVYQNTCHVKRVNLFFENNQFWDRLVVMITRFRL